MSKIKDKIETEPALFRDLINKSNDAIFVADPETGLFIFVNDKACASLGYERQELLKMGVTDIEASLPDNFLWQTHVNELRQKGSLTFEGAHKRKNGEAFPVEANISHVVLNSSEYLVTVVRDITERKQIEGTMRLQSEIAGNISEGIYLVSAKDLKIVYANPKIEEMFGYDHGEMNGKHVSIINAPTEGDPAETARQIEKALKESGAWRGEVYNIRKNGTTFWSQASISMLHHSDYGDVYLSLQTDITEQKKIEEALQQSEERYRAIVENQAEFVARYLPGGILTFVNDTLCRYVGLGRKDLIGKSYYPFMHADDRESFVRKIEALDRDAPVMVAEARVVLPDSRVTWHRWTHHAIFDDLGRLVEYQSSGRDVTELKEAEERLRESEEKYRLLVETANSVILTWDTRGNILFMNVYGEQFFGFDKEELIGRNVVGTIVPETESSGRDLAHLMQEIQRDPDRFKDNENENITKDGRRVWIRWTNKAIIDARGGLTGILSVGNDITERKRAEAALLAREKQLAESQRIAHIGSWEHNLKTDRVFWSDELFRLFGLDPGKDQADIAMFFDMMHPRDQPLLKKAIDETLRDRKPFDMDYRLIRGDGTIRILHAQAELLADDAGDLVVLSGTAQDITERKQAEEVMQLTRFTVDNVADAVYWLDCKARLVDVNGTACSMLGYTREELLNLTVFDIDPDYTAEIWATSWEALKGKRKRTVETRHRAKDGRIIPVEIMANYLSFGGREFACAFARDISERKRAEQDLLKTQKLESLGILAGGIAHDFNNILTAIMGNISLARMKMAPEDPQSKRLEEAERASYHARELTQQLLTFAKGGAPIKNTVSLEQLIRDAARFAIRGSNVRCDFSFSEDLLSVDVDEGQMGQVFNNLVINACQAMPQGGTILIDVQNVAIGSEEGMSLPQGTYVMITIKDQGTGISEEHQQRIFDPYFTTKQTGSGLGLSIVHSVIRNHNGRITVKSRPGAGTTFIIYLPASTNKVAKKALQAKEDISGKGRVLLMDDEEIVRTVTGEILKVMGYEVEFASDGAEAIRLYETAMASSRPFDAVIMDLTVPGGMGGKEAIAKLRETDPGIRAIVSSGYSQDPIMANYREYGFSEVIAKPFNSSELGRTIRKVILKS